MKTVRRKYNRRRTKRRFHRTKKLYQYGGKKRMSYQSGGNPLDDEPASQEDIAFVTDAIMHEDVPILLAEHIVEAVKVSDPSDACVPQIVGRCVPLPKKVSLFGKLIEILFGRKDLHFEGKLFNDFLKLPPTSRYDVPAKFTMHMHRDSIFHNCNLNIKSKQLENQNDEPYKGRIEVGDIVVFNSCLKDAQDASSPGFLMIVEDYFLENQGERVVGLVGKYRRVYDLKSQLGTIFGSYTEVQIEELYKEIQSLKEQCPVILKNPNREKRVVELNKLKDDIDVLNARMTSKGCLLQLARKESTDCRTDYTPGTGRQPALRIQGTLAINRLESKQSSKGNFLEDIGLPFSPIGVGSPKAGPKIYDVFSKFVLTGHHKRSEPSAALVSASAAPAASAASAASASRARSQSRGPRRERSRSANRASSANKASTTSARGRKIRHSSAAFHKAIVRERKFIGRERNTTPRP